MDDSEERDTVEHHENALHENELSHNTLSKEDDSGRPNRRTSKVWQVFNRLSDNNAQCNLCSRVLSYKSSVTNLAKHIQRKHPATFASIGGGEDPREGLKEFITIDGGRDEVAAGDEGDEDPIRLDDGEWLPPSKSARRSTASARKVIKKEIISSNGVDYVIYTEDQMPRPPPPKTAKKTISSSRTAAGRTPTMSLTPTQRASSPLPQLHIEEDEFATFAKFLSQRIRALKNPYWQSCAINEINSALHRIEMRRYEMPKVDSAQSFVQTDPMDPVILKASSMTSHADHEGHHVVEVISQDLV